MKVLIIKTSSLGDILHTFPALTDAGKVFPDVKFTWVVEENFASLPHWHPLVEKVIPIALRRWRKHIGATLRSGEANRFIKTLRQEKFDYVIDAQGLLKSALIAKLARGPRYGLDKHSAREALASLFYQHKITVPKGQHAITRIRALFAEGLGYSLPANKIEYGLCTENLPVLNFCLSTQYVVFCHGTTWASKHYPLEYWEKLVVEVAKKSLTILLPWHDATEQARAQHLASFSPLAKVLPKLNLPEMARLLVEARAVVSVDTGLGHLSAAFGIPTISLYGPTNPNLTGTQGDHQFHLAANFPCAPCLQRHCTFIGESTVKPACFGTVAPMQILAQLDKLLE